MVRHRSPGGQHPYRPNHRHQPHHPCKHPGGRTSGPSSLLRGRVVVAAVATGAFVAAGQSLAAGQGQAQSHDYAPLSGRATPTSLGSITGANAVDGLGGNAPAPEVLPVTKPVNGNSELDKLTHSEQFSAAHRDIAARTSRPQFVKPTQGVFSTGFGGRWGSIHYGIDIANVKGTPIVSVADGIVIDAGPASGFGQWVRVQHWDGTITVYGHVDTILVQAGQEVRAGDEIATMGNRGFATGPQLHFEVWDPSGKKINPVPWLEERGITVT